MTENGWMPTRHGGLRRQRAVAQLVERHPDLVDADRARGTQAVEATEAVHGSRRGYRLTTRVGFKSLPRDNTSGRWCQERHADSVLSKVRRLAIRPNTARETPSKWAWAWCESLGLPTCPYVIRWRVETPWGSVRVHHWLAPDDDRARHDHPWSFVTFVLRGGYTDVSPDGDEHLRAPAIRRRAATHQHTVVPDPGGAWTVVIAGPKTRQWGFWVRGKFVKSYRYFYKYGHHPCD